jgi:hypothetical protein
MLKITTIDTPTEQKLIREGRLTAPCIGDLSSRWEGTRNAYPERKFVVDLRGVMRIDSGGESVLALMKTEGAEFMASGVRIKHLVMNLRGSSPEESDGRREWSLGSVPAEVVETFADATQDQAP